MQFYDKDTYVAYIIERSTDNKTYMPTTTIPFTNPDVSNELYTPYIYRVDSLPDNESIYYFRVSGVTSFGDIGPPSDPVSGRGQYLSYEVPELAPPKINKLDNVIELNWSFPEDLNSEIQGFFVEKSNKSSGVYTTLNSKLISPGDRRIVVPAKSGVGYYRVIAKDSRGKERASLPYLVQLADSIPPAAPENFSSAIDSLNVILRWDRSNEGDILGYHIYKANFPDSEFYQITKDLISEDNFWIDSALNFKSLHKDLYYRIRAVDSYFNQSEFSKTLKVEIPDIQPPIPSLIKQAKSTFQGVELSWVPSSSEDLAHQILYRTKSDSINWVRIYEFSSDDTFYNDTDLISG